MPFMQINPGESGEPQVTPVGTPPIIQTEDDRKARLMQERESERQAERYDNLVARPPTSEGRKMTEETRKRLEQESKDKAAAHNVVTIGSDISKVAGGDEGVTLVPTANVYVMENPNEGPHMEIEDPTVSGGAVRSGFTTLDRAEATLKQPKGDERSALSATGPTLPMGPGSVSDEETEPAADAKGKQSVDEQLRAGSEDAAAAAEKAESKRSTTTPDSAAAPKGKKG
jgi:hypothetical protein